MREAAVSALRELFDSIDLDGPAIDSALPQAQGQAVVQMRHFEVALRKANPSVSRQQRRRFEALRKKFAGTPVGHKGEPVEQEQDGAEEVKGEAQEQ